jgi:hypothetical protein
MKLNIKRSQIQGNSTVLDLLISKEVETLGHLLQPLSKARYIDFDKGGLENIFFNNPNYFNIAIRTSKTFSQIRVSVRIYIISRCSHPWQKTS